MRVLGVDPGSVVTGWGVVRGSSTRPELVDSGVIRLGGSSDSFPERLHRLSRLLEELVARHRPTTAAVEAPFHGVNARSALQLAHARGVVLAVLAGAGVSVVEYTPASIKVSVTGSGRADKAQIHAMVMRLLKLRELPGPADRADALAVALCHLASAPYSSAVGGGRARRRV